MTSKLKCPFCGETLRQSKHIEPLTGQNPYFCDTHDCYPSECCIGTKQIWQALEESQQATLTNAQTVLEIHKDLEIAQEALEKLICEYNRCRRDEFEGVDINWEWWVMAAKNTVETALKQIKHKE